MVFLNQLVTKPGDGFTRWCQPPKGRLGAPSWPEVPRPAPGWVAHARGSRAAGDDDPSTRSSTLPSGEEAQRGRVKAEPAALAAVVCSHREGHGGAQRAQQLTRQDAAPAFIQENATVQRFASSAAEEAPGRSSRLLRVMLQPPDSLASSLGGSLGPPLLAPVTAANSRMQKPEQDALARAKAITQPVQKPSLMLLYCHSDLQCRPLGCYNRQRAPEARPYLC